MAALSPDDQLAPIDRFQLVFNRLYGSEYRAAKRMLHPKLQQKRMGAPRGPTLYERILLFRKLRGDGEGEYTEKAEIFDDVNGEKAVTYKSESRPDDVPVISRSTSRKDSPVISSTPSRKQAYRESNSKTNVTARGDRSDTSFESVDIADFANLEDDEPKRSPSPQPTFTKNAVRITPHNTPPELRSTKESTTERIVRQDTPENATPRQILVELDTHREQQKVIDDQHHTIWDFEDDEESRQPSTVENKTISSRQIIRDEKHTINANRTPTPKRLPTPKRSPTPSNLNPHTVLSSINKTVEENETHVDNTVVRNDTKHTDIDKEIVENKYIKEDVDIIEEATSVSHSEDAKVNRKFEVKEEKQDIRSEVSSEKTVDKSYKQEHEVSKTEETREEHTSENNTEVKSERSELSSKEETIESNSTEEKSNSSEEETKASNNETHVEETNESKDVQHKNEEDNNTAAIAAAATIAGVPVVAATASVAASSNKPQKTPPNNTEEPVKANGSVMDDKERDNAIEQLDKLADHTINSLIDPSKAGEAPVVDKEILDRVFSQEFQDDLDKFLNSP